MNIKNDTIANGGFCKASGLQKVYRNLHDELLILCSHKFHKVDVLFLPLLLRYLMYSVLLFCLCFFLCIVYHISFVFQEFLLYCLFSTLLLFLAIRVYWFYDTLFSHHNNTLDFVDVVLSDILPSIVYNMGQAIGVVLFYILDKFSYKNNSMVLTLMQGHI